MSSVMKKFVCYEIESIFLLIHKAFIVNKKMQNCCATEINVEVKVSPLRAMKAHGGCGCERVHIYTATALGRGRVASPALRKIPCTHFIGG